MSNINEIMETYQSFVDSGLMTLEAAQDMFDDNLNDYILETKSDIDNAYNEGLITAYEKNICYINIGLDVEENYDEVITNLIESYITEFNSDDSVVEEKKTDSNDIPSKEEYYRQLMAKEAKKQKRKAFFKKVGTAAALTGAVVGGAYLANKAEKAGNDRKVVRPDNPEYAELFKQRDKKIDTLNKKYDAAIKSAKTDIEKDDITKQYKNDISNTNMWFSNQVNEYKSKKRAIYDENKAKEQEAYDRAMANTTDPEKRADYERHHKEAQDRWNYDKENSKKMDQFDRSDYHRRTELNREDPENMGKLKRLIFKKRQEKKMDKINKRYDNYNKKNIK